MYISVRKYIWRKNIHLDTSERKLVNYIYVHLENQMYLDVNCWENPGKQNVHAGTFECTFGGTFRCTEM